MGMLKNKQEQASTTTNAKAPRDRFIIGTSECYFEAAQYLTGKMNATKVKSLLNHPNSVIAETGGKSLKLNFTTPSGENKFMGFITAGDASLELDAEDIPSVVEHAQGEITKAIDVDSLVALF